MTFYVQFPPWDPFFERPGKFSGSKSHFINHKALDALSFNRFCMSSELALMQRFECKNHFVFQPQTFKLCRTFETRAPDHLLDL